MKTKFKSWLCLSVITTLCITNLHAQSDGVTLRFSANHTCAHAELDSVLIENLSQGGSTTLYYPDRNGQTAYLSEPRPQAGICRIRYTNHQNQDI